MASVTTYSCDQCGKPVSDLYGRLHVVISSDVEPQVNADLDLCSLNCLETYAFLGGQFGRDRVRARASK